MRALWCRIKTNFCSQKLVKKSNCWVNVGASILEFLNEARMIKSLIAKIKKIMLEL